MKFFSLITRKQDMDRTRSSSEKNACTCININFISTFPPFLLTIDEKLNLFAVHSCLSIIPGMIMLIWLANLKNKAGPD